MIWPRVAPSDRRMAISLRRAPARASSKLATLSRAISSTSAHDRHQQLADADELVAEIWIDEPFGQRQEPSSCGPRSPVGKGRELRGGGLHARIGLLAADAGFQASDEGEQRARREDTCRTSG